MNKTAEIEISRLHAIYRGCDKKMREFLEGIFGKDAFTTTDDEMFEVVKSFIECCETASDVEINETVKWLESYRARTQTVASNSKIAPWAVEADGKIVGVAVPIINKVFYFDDIPEGDEEMNWDDAMAFAKERGRTLPSKRELHLCYFFKDEINAIAEAAGHPDFLSGWIWSSTEYNTNIAWHVHFNSGYVTFNNKCYTSYVVRPVADI